MTYLTIKNTSADRNIRRRSWCDQVGLYVLYFLLLLQPFHFIVSEQFLYYRETFTVVFCLLLIYNFLTTSFHTNIDFRVRKEIFYLLLFCALLIYFGIADPGISLYGADNTGASEQLSTISPTLYVIRNALIYVPMVLYFAVRGINEIEIKRIAMIIVFVAPFSVWSFFIYSTTATLGIEVIFAYIIALGGETLSYNSYVPYLTFPVIASFFLLTTDSAKVLKLLYGLIGAGLAFYILFSTSRQSFLFVIIVAVFFLFSFTGYKRLKMVGLILGITTFGWLMFIQFGSVFEISDKFLDRYTTVSGMTETSRLEYLQQGLGLLEFHEYLTGAGLSSVIVSGPHNDYVRWLQRIGLIGMIVGFTPFIIGFRKAFALSRVHKNSPVYMFICLTIAFTLYHSFFGYPREDAFQALYCFLGLAIWLGFSKSGIKQKLKQDLHAPAHSLGDVNGIVLKSSPKG